jgi:hypothetical protein
VSALRVLPDGKVQVGVGDKESTMEMFNPEFTWPNLLHRTASISAILRSQMRGALIGPIESKARLFKGPLAASDEDGSSDLKRQLDRSGHTLTEITSRARLAAGGLHSFGQRRATALVFSSSTASVTADKTDYLPGDTCWAISASPTNGTRGRCSIVARLGRRKRMAS